VPPQHVELVPDGGAPVENAFENAFECGISAGLIA
jgi:hypothetical protein